MRNCIGEEVDAFVLGLRIANMNPPIRLHGGRHELSKTAEECKTHATTKFEGVKANTGFAVHSKTVDGKNLLVLSDDFKIPETPAPHWQIVDSKGNVYLLNMLKIKGDKFNKQITLPSYIHDIAKVQIWCSFAETLLGEASFAMPVK